MNNNTFSQWLQPTARLCLYFLFCKEKGISEVIFRLGTSAQMIEDYHTQGNDDKYDGNKLPFVFREAERQIERLGWTENG